MDYEVRSDSSGYVEQYCYFPELDPSLILLIFFFLGII